jgi:hypothetical protein
METRNNRTEQDMVFHTLSTHMVCVDNHTFNECLSELDMSLENDEFVFVRKTSLCNLAKNRITLFDEGECISVPDLIDELANIMDGNVFNAGIPFNDY